MLYSGFIEIFFREVEVLRARLDRQLLSAIVVFIAKRFCN